MGVAGTMAVVKVTPAPSELSPCVELEYLDWESLSLYDSYFEFGYLVGYAFFSKEYIVLRLFCT